MLPPCWFRGLLAEVIGGGVEPGSATHERMVRLALCRTDLGTRDGAVLLPGEVVRIEDGITLTHLHAVAAPLADVEAIARAVGDTEPDDGLASPLEVLPVEDLGVTVLRQASPHTPAASDAAADRLRTVAIRVAIERLERELAARVEHPARRATAPRHRTTDKDT